MLSGFKRVLLGRPRDVLDPGVFHKVSLAAFLAWVGLGADGLSSSAYGPEEAFKALGPHGYLAVAMAGAIALTVFIISYAYSRIIEHFPFGGGGYVVATRLLGRTAGVVSGSALIVDYVLTIAISIAAGVARLAWRRGGGRERGGDPAGRPRGGGVRRGPRPRVPAPRGNARPRDPRPVGSPPPRRPRCGAAAARWLPSGAAGAAPERS